MLLSHLRLPQPGGSGPCIYVPQEQGGPVIPPGTSKPKSRYDRRSVSVSWCRAPSGSQDQMFVTVMSLWDSLSDERSGLTFANHGVCSI
jgi:hypothetical protein